MPGPPPKNPRTRQRRNRAATAATLAGEKRPRSRTPRLPAVTERETVWQEHPVYDEAGEQIGTMRVAVGEVERPRTWHPLTRAWWHDIWRSPMHAEYLQVDVHRLYILADLVDRYWQAPSVPLATEIRLQGQAFGLTPIDRRRLQWQVEGGQIERPAREPRERSLEQSRDPRALLSVV